MAGWQSGHAAACKAVYAGSIPTPASTTLLSAWISCNSLSTAFNFNTFGKKLPPAQARNGKKHT